MCVSGAYGDSNNYSIWTLHSGSSLIAQKIAGNIITAQDLTISGNTISVYPNYIIYLLKIADYFSY